MSLALKNCVDPWKACDQGLVLSGEIALADFARLAPDLIENQGVIEFDVEFGRDLNKTAVLAVRLSGALKLKCQRCLQALDMPVNTELNLAFVKAITAETQQLDSIYDLFEVEDDQVCLLNVIEDELLLLVPQVPMHSAPACVIETEFGDKDVEAVAEEKENPFAVLASLKTKQDG